MKLLTKALEAKLPPLYSQEENPDPMCLIKFFDPWSRWTWYGIEYDPKDRLFFGYVIGTGNELGYFSLDELKSLRRIERDMYYDPELLSTIMARGY